MCIATAVFIFSQDCTFFSLISFEAAKIRSIHHMANATLYQCISFKRSHYIWKSFITLRNILLQLYKYSSFMKISEKTIKIISGILFLLGIVIIIYVQYYNSLNKFNPSEIGELIGYSFLFIGLALLIPWRNKKD